MRSKITIEVDFDNGNDSAIYIKSEHTDDIRDKLVQDFISKFAGQSNWCRADFMTGDRVRIKPITAQQLHEQANLMQLMSNEYSKPTSPTPPLPLHKPLDYDIPVILKELKYGRPAKAHGMIDTLIEAWEWMLKGGVVICRDGEAVKDDSICYCLINDKEIAFERQSNGDRIYLHAGLNPATHELWLATNHDDMLIEASKKIYTLDDGDKFYTTKKQINNG